MTKSIVGEWKMGFLREAPPQQCCNEHSAEFIDECQHGVSSPEVCGAQNKQETEFASKWTLWLRDKEQGKPLKEIFPLSLEKGALPPDSDLTLQLLVHSGIHLHYGECSLSSCCATLFRGDGSEWIKLIYAAPSGKF